MSIHLDISKIENNDIKILDFIKHKNKNYNFQCSKGHVWNARFSNVLRSLNRESKGCPQCAKDIYDKISENVLNKNLIDGHKVLSYKLKQTSKDGRKERYYKIECPYGHHYENKSYNLKDGCPKCSVGVFVGEERVRVIFETHFKEKFKKVRPSWLVNPKTNKKLEIDGYNSDLKIGFEYQGRQHHSDSNQFNACSKEQSERDTIKLKICTEKGIKLYIINQPSSYTESNFISNVLEQLKEQGLLINNSSYSFAHINQDIYLKRKYEEFKEIVEKENIALLSDSLGTLEDVLQFQCPKSHHFKMTGLNFKEILKSNSINYFCPECNKENGIGKELFSVNDIKEFANSIGYTLLSNTYSNVNEKMHWKCNNGHELIKSYRQFQRNKTGNYCEKCIDLKLEKRVNYNASGQFKSKSGEAITIEDVKAYANSIDFILLTNVYLNINEKMHWQCNNGHDVIKSYRQFLRNKTGNYCEECIRQGLIKKVISNAQFNTKSGVSNTIENIKEFAKSIGYELLADTYNNVNEKMQWKCPNGHNVIKSYRQFQRNRTGNYCEQCPK